ncbi:Serpentine Receptor, class T [Caenorhabditis elegans]|uniref:Serpentine Receptor, class T n=1 Tax=Caenorhabditis elegans TaxID=6239 RepID=O76702_CAEEL|nr:Serpentine Receptor, class T [Caenorhabditis elegans]CCD70117.1 Serpentine Receptor, class T [Caenorhabditis elegans]|eukprot:NP_505236.1 Uncharacterized protein CELE_ZC190.2 [Caenorhabditis elegans]
MGTYEDYVCVPYPNNLWWLPIVILQFIVVIAGCFSHFIFVSLVVIPHKFGIYLRMAFGMISTMMLIMLLTSTGAFLITLAHGKFIEDCEISSIHFRKQLLFVHSFGEYFFVACELLGTIERVISTLNPKFRKSKFFSAVFIVGCIIGMLSAFLYIYLVRISYDSTLFAIGFGSLTMMEILNGCIVFSLFYTAKEIYQNQRSAPLHVRYELFQSYAYCRCAAASFTARVFIIAYVYLKLAGFFGGDMDSGFFYMMNLFINLYCLVYPWTIMLYHRKIKSQIKQVLATKNWFRSKRIKEENTKTLYTIDGRRMNRMSTDDHFNQLNAFWNLSTLPSPTPSKNHA